jgi:hypothetical protein
MLQLISGKPAEKKELLKTVFRIIDGSGCLGSVRWITDPDLNTDPDLDLDLDLNADHDPDQELDFLLWLSRHQSLKMPQQVIKKSQKVLIFC